MSRKFLKSFFIILGLSVFLLIFGLFFRLSLSRAASAASASLMEADLQKAGFTQVKQIAPTTATGRFAGPQLYFQVSDKVTAPNSEAPNVVMVSDFVSTYQLGKGALFNYGADSHDFSVLGGSGQEATMFDGRVAINFIKNNHYDVIIGPNKSKIEALATLLAGEIQ